MFTVRKNKRPSYVAAVDGPSFNRIPRVETYIESRTMPTPGNETETNCPGQVEAVRLEDIAQVEQRIRCCNQQLCEWEAASKQRRSECTQTFKRRLCECDQQIEQEEENEATYRSELVN